MNKLMSARLKLLLMALLTILCFHPYTVNAEVTLDEVFKLLPFSEEEKQKILQGEIVKTLPDETADDEMAVSLAFMIKNKPENIALNFVGGKTIDQSSTIDHHQLITSEADFKGLGLTTDEVDEFLNASPGDKLNLSNDEIAAFKAIKAKGLSGTDASTQVLSQFHAMLFKRYQAYKAGGVMAIAPYQREDGEQYKAGDYLQSVAQDTPILEKLYPKFHKILLEYPKIKDPALKEHFFWMKMTVEKRPTFVLVHRMIMEENGAYLAVARQYYASQGFNAEQELGMLVPTEKDSLAVLITRASSDEVTGFGSSTKRFIGRRLMADGMTDFFKAMQKKLGK
jgi:hypothetical protein